MHVPTPHSSLDNSSMAIKYCQLAKFLSVFYFYYNLTLLFKICTDEFILSSGHTIKTIYVENVS